MWLSGFSTILTGFLYILTLTEILPVDGQMSTDPRLCGGYFREFNGYIDFKFNEVTAPPDIAMRNKFCVWTITPTVPSERFAYNMTIRNVNLDCAKDSITINYFNETADHTDLGDPNTGDPRNPLCIEPREIWQRNNTWGTVMVVVLHVDEIVYGKGFYLQWEEGYNARYNSSAGRIRNTYYSYGKPGVDPFPYFAAGFFSNEIATFGFIKANYTDGYTMDLTFSEIRMCEGQGDWQKCFNNTVSIYSFADDGELKLVEQHKQNVTLTPTITSKNGFFIIVKIQDAFGAGGRFQLVYETVRD